MNESEQNSFTECFSHDTLRTLTAVLRWRTTRFFVQSACVIEPEPNILTNSYRIGTFSREIRVSDIVRTQQLR